MEPCVPCAALLSVSSIAAKPWGNEMRFSSRRVLFVFVGGLSCFFFAAYSCADGGIAFSWVLCGRKGPFLCSILAGEKKSVRYNLKCVCFFVSL